MNRATTKQARSELAIGQLAAATGLAASAIRYYERVGLLEPARRVGGKRRYRTDAVSKLTMIGVAQDAGFTLAEIKTLLAGLGHARRGTAALQRLATNKLPEVDAALRRLKMVKRLLQAAERCECPDLETCVTMARKTGIGPESR